MAKKAKHEKRSQMGGSSPNAAVSGSNPTVQASPQSTAPSTPSAYSTVTKVGEQIKYAAFVDEFEKIMRR